MGIGGTEGKTNNIRKEKQSTLSSTARTEQAQELVRPVVLSKIPKEPHSDGTRARRSGSVVRKNAKANTDETDMEEERRRKGDASH